MVNNQLEIKAVDLEGIDKYYENEFPNAISIKGFQDIYDGEALITLNDGTTIKSTYTHSGYGYNQKHILSINGQTPITFLEVKNHNLEDYNKINQLWEEFDYSYPKIIKHYYNQLKQ